MSPKRAHSIVEAIEAKQRRIEQQRQRRLNSPVRERHNEQQRQYRMNMSENQRALQRENSRLRMQRIRQGDNLPLPTGTCFEEDQIPLHFCSQLDQVCPKCRAKFLNSGKKINSEIYCQDLQAIHLEFSENCPVWSIGKALFCFTITHGHTLHLRPEKNCSIRL
ncbi:hypothetical protein LAZ67_1001669 [Cordylochernes scorpioides]|uniref:Uncharacterized protein n=1 Tax=Cordylochernes scorpioides TaxID=51811 RepID=A0ABY6K0B0_9ARAC|nr:hypothetical protein LAZ67_1001669 [Cordylochernes scorpioides]